MSLDALMVPHSAFNFAIFLILFLLVLVFYVLCFMSPSSMQPALKADMKVLLNQGIDRLINSRGSMGGLIKRIDENRELLQTLQLKAPQLLVECPWIIGWISANDSFFVQLDQLLLAKGRRPNFPRTLGGLNDSI
jgi:hypothetical protein